MLVFPNAKINLGLNVVEKRNDGYHNLETIFYPVEIKDALEIIINTENNEPVLFKSSGLKIDVDAEKNLCVKAYHLLKKDFDLPNIVMHLHKVIPMGAGLGGGSSDAAFVLSLLNKKFNLNISQEKLIEYSLQLGSDCPFFIVNKPCFATSRGEILQPLELDLSNYIIKLFHPKIHISTAQAFSNITPQHPKFSILEIIKQPIYDWKSNLINDFEASVFTIHPQFKELKKELYNQGAVYVSMTGTGSCFYAIFKKERFSINNIKLNQSFSLSIL